MPWKESSVMNERMNFVMRALDGEKITQLCKEFGISRVTGTKILKRFEEEGALGLYDKSKKPKNFGNGLSSTIVKRIEELAERYPSFGAPKIQEKYKSKFQQKPPAISTIHRYLDSWGLVEKRTKRRRHKSTGTYLGNANAANDIWACDYKGQFRLKNKQLCYPLTISDLATRYLLLVEALENTKSVHAVTAFERVFKEFGVPKAIRSDNGVPFSSVSIFGLSTLNIFWLKQGIKFERIEPGKPQQNGVHERMHLSLKRAVIRPHNVNILRQQELFDEFVEEFNKERPHQGIDMKTPASLYKKGKGFNAYYDEYFYPDSELERKVSGSGAISIDNKQIMIGKALANERVGLEQVDEQIWLIKFLDYELGFIDDIEYKFTSGESPFNFRVVKKNT